MVEKYLAFMNTHTHTHFVSFSLSLSHISYPNLSSPSTYSSPHVYTAINGNCKAVPILIILQTKKQKEKIMKQNHLILSTHS